MSAAALAIQVDQAPLATDLARLVTAVLVRQELAAPALAEIDFLVADPALFRVFRIGAALSIAVGSAGTPIFEGEVTALSHLYGPGHALAFRIRAYDRLQRLRKSFRPRLLQDVSAVDLAASLAADLGLSARATTDPPRRPALVQHEQSDFDLLADLAAEAGLYPVLRDGTLLLVALDGEGAEIPLTFGRELIELVATVSNDRNQRGSVAASWNATAASAATKTVTLSRQDAQEFRDTSPNEGANGHRQSLNRLAEGEAETEALAAAEFDRAVAAAASIRATVLGDPALCPGRPVSLLGVAEPVAGRYVPSAVTHKVSADAGYLTELSSDPPARRSRPRQPAATLGVVTDTADPEHRGRARVAFPALGGTDSPWMQVVTAGAGEGRGLAAFPEVDDKVLVLMPDGDPARGIILGSLYAEAGLPRGFRAARPRPFILRTGGGQRLELASTEATARLATSAGSLLELMPGSARLATVSDLVIEAPGRTITFRANFINFERG
ncbi:phage baseplate assembly protein V [Aureimonas leprariae]|uniref:Gp5/Type VI secretion system Vgr protein OB-fold domain-containing protein n=1 Tax=Plantimonas leprariae TaxID=2615207 RepID=A0A7V7PRG0_9HYPH|nr:phage baseplate assembly protein V [Aureimonas leprariae]KAB0681335.1 hypothetical protein F6X38_05470 [Aureimonas leprariae]